MCIIHSNFVCKYNYVGLYALGKDASINGVICLFVQQETLPLLFSHFQAQVNCVGIVVSVQCRPFYDIFFCFLPQLLLIPQSDWLIYRCR